jgi:sec-independent protein translocase protein TatA
MGLGGINLSELLIILVIVVLIFGTKRLKSIGSDIGGAIKGFRASAADDKQPEQEDAKPLPNQQPDAEFPEQKQKTRQG